jgi:hypothetical protein
MYKLLPLLVLLVLPLGECGEGAPPPPAQPQAPPEPTAQEIRGELRNSIQPLMQASGPQAELPPAVRNEAVSAFNQVRAKHSAGVNAQEAFEQFTTEVESLISTARTNEAWGAVKGGIEVYKSLSPGSDRYTNLEQRADIMLARPSVRVGGFFGTGDATEIFMEVTDPQLQRQTQTYRVREGEEFHEKPTEQGPRPVLRVVRIIGNNAAVEIEYMPIQDTWTVQGPRQ